MEKKRQKYVDRMGNETSMSPIYRRLFAYAAYKKWNDSNLASKMGLRESRLSEMKSGKTRNPQILSYVELINNSDINPEWLFLGTGPVVRGQARKGIETPGVCEKCEDLKRQIERIQAEHDKYRKDVEEWRAIIKREHDKR